MILGWSTIAEKLMGRARGLTVWEQEFLWGINNRLRRGNPVSERQYKTLAHIMGAHAEDLRAPRRPTTDPRMRKRIAEKRYGPPFNCACLVPVTDDMWQVPDDQMLLRAPWVLVKRDCKVCLGTGREQV